MGNSRERKGFIKNQTRRQFLKFSGLTSAGLGLSKIVPLARLYAMAGPQGDKTKQPNLLFVFSDQHRKQAMGFMNADPVKTPNFDRFAEESMVFTNAISMHPVCSPYRGCTFSGRYPLSNGVTANGGVWFPGVTPIFEVLQQAGYHTGYIGKWHLDGLYKKSWVAGDKRYRKWCYSEKYDQWYWTREWTPRQLRPYFDFWHGNHCFNEMFRLNYFEEDPNDPVLGRRWQPDHETDVAIDYIRKRKKEDKPFALFLSWNPPHAGSKFVEPENKITPDKTPFIWEGVKTSEHGFYAPEKFKALYSNLEDTDRPNYRGKAGKKDVAQHLDGYFGAVTSLDENFGRLMKYLEDEGIADNTIVVYTSDHGTMMGSHGRMGKRLWYEESIGVPFMIRWPRTIKTAREDMPFSNVHIMPTLLGLMGLAIPSEVEGEDYSAFLHGEKIKKPKSVLIEYVCTLLRKTPESKSYYIHPTKGYGLASGEWRGIRTKRHTYVIQLFKGKTTRYLYNLKTDPYQMKPLKTYQKLDKQMESFEKELRMWLEKTNDPFLKWLDGEEKTPECLLQELT